MSKLRPIIEDSMIQYSGAVLQSRALVDVRDGLKPSARQIFYSMLLHKLTHDKPYKKTANAVGMAMADFYIHGDSSCEGVIMRAGQPFAMRYPLIDVKGNAGSLIESGDWAAMRYTESRLSKISNILFSDINKDTISEWRDNYDNTKQYPSVLPTKGFYNICNGSQGIGIGMASSIPQYNLKEMNKVLEKLLLNPESSFEDIYIAPDFATGAILLNENEIKESMRTGSGFACKLRSIVEFNKGERCFIVTEIPYGTYTNTICKELENIINGEDNPGIERFNDLTGKTPLIKIYLKRATNPDKILKYLYKNTSLQSYYSINFTMLDRGRFPKVFTWKEMLQAHIDHEKEVYRRGYEFDLKKIEDRIHIIEGLLKVIVSIDEVVQTIKKAESTEKAKQQLIAQYELDGAQAKAVLDMKLARLAHLEVEKLKNEKSKLEKEREFIYNIINNEELFNNELIKGWREVANKFGDERRTQILNISKEDEEPQELRQLSINLSNQNNIYINEVSSLYSQSRGGVGQKFKMSKGEYVISTQYGDNKSIILFFTKEGNCYHAKLSEIPFEEIVPIESISNMPIGEETCWMTVVNKETLANNTNNIIFFTKKGYIKKSKLSEYNISRKTGIKALALEDNDQICSAIVTNKDRVGMLTARGQFVMCETENIRSTGRVTKGVKGIVLNPDDELIYASMISKDTKELISVSENGYIKRTPITEFNVTNRGVKGGKIHRLKNEEDNLVAFLPLKDESQIIIVANNSQIKIKVQDISILGKGAQGTKSINLKDKAKVVGMTIF